MAGVRIINRSGQTLALGEEPDWIDFSIERVGGGFVRQLSDPPVQRPFKLESTQQGTLSVDLAPCYDLRQAGIYQISAQVKVKDWDSRLAAKPVRFEIIEGTKLWEQAVGIPQSASNQQPEIRTYSLQQANYLAEPRLYLRVSSSDGTVIKLLNVGRILSFGRPEPILDKRSRLHLLHQDGARSSEYLVVNPNGSIEIRQTYEYGDSRPRLRLDENGEVNVSGGIRRPSPKDLPPEVEPKTDANKNENP